MLSDSEKANSQNLNKNFVGEQKRNTTEQLQKRKKLYIYMIKNLSFYLQHLLGSQHLKWLKFGLEIQQPFYLHMFLHLGYGRHLYFVCAFYSNQLRGKK